VTVQYCVSYSSLSSITGHYLNMNGQCDIWAAFGCQKLWRKTLNRICSFIMTVQSQVCKDGFSTPVFYTHQDIDMVDDATVAYILILS